MTSKSKKPTSNDELVGLSALSIGGIVMVVIGVIGLMGGLAGSLYVSDE